MINIRRIYILLFSALLFATGCTERKLEQLSGYRVSIALEWNTLAPPADVRFYFYPRGIEQPIIVNTSSEGFYGDLPEGEYDVLVLETNPVNVGLRGEERFSTAQIYVPQINSKLAEPGYFAMGNRIKNKSVLVIPPKDQVFEKIVMSQQVYTFNIIFKFSNGLPPDINLSGALMGTSPDKQCSTMAYSDVRIPTDFVATPSSGDAMSASVRSLGYTPISGQGDLSIDMSIGQQQFDYLLDLTWVIQQIISDNGGVLPLSIELGVLIDIDGINMTATVTEWGFGADGSGTVE